MTPLLTFKSMYQRNLVYKLFNAYMYLQSIRLDCLTGRAAKHFPSSWIILTTFFSKNMESQVFWVFGRYSMIACLVMLVKSSFNYDVAYSPDVIICLKQAWPHSLTTVPFR